MIGAAIDRAVSKSPAFEKIFKNRINTIYGTNMAGETAVFLIASAAAGIFASFGNDAMFIISLITAAAVWIQTAFIAGFMRGWLFAMFLLIYFWLPGIFIIPGDAVQPVASYGFQNVLNDLSRLIWASPATRLLPDADLTASMLAVAALEMAVFFIGSRVRAVLKHSSAYCRIRLEQLGNEEDED